MDYDMGDRYEQKIDVPGSVMRSYTINFPVHAVVETLEVGVAPGSKLGEGRKYRDLPQIVFYGSSIVHGTAASRPGLIYENYVCRALDMDYINLGFSGHAKGEPAIAQWMATLPMSIFVCDYDHNAPTAEHLAETHYPLYETIRAKNPDVPYIMITRPNYWFSNDLEDILRRRDVVLRSYLKAREAGDRNVYFIDGTAFFENADMYDCVMDGIHPNDTGFLRMGETIAAQIRHILQRKNG